ncbi:MAG: DUF448 domain-containing protein [Candidatus Eremiobacteraeota bacterium]|nr:DUF448 domain-containing protein [Candidatus Eremiobacteraeota bacterium]MBV8356257.1 DUF448 domain-containing protein [Candidatus Eremiobacteraeota bacterium]
MTPDTRTPIRTCVGCRERRDQSAMVRFVRRDGGGGGEWSADRGRRSEGRGAYLCSAQCAGRVAKNKRYPGLAAAARSLDVFSQTA